MVSIPLYLGLLERTVDESALPFALKDICLTMITIPFREEGLPFLEHHVKVF
jgi:hypothetical protein